MYHTAENVEKVNSSRRLILLILLLLDLVEKNYYVQLHTLGT